MLYNGSGVFGTTKLIKEYACGACSPRVLVTSMLMSNVSWDKE
jgi:hypothetical protein